MYTRTTRPAPSASASTTKCACAPWSRFLPPVHTFLRISCLSVRGDVSSKVHTCCSSGGWNKNKRLDFENKNTFRLGFEPLRSSKPDLIVLVFVRRGRGGGMQLQWCHTRIHIHRWLHILKTYEIHETKLCTKIPAIAVKFYFQPLNVFFFFQFVPFGFELTFDAHLCMFVMFASGTMCFSFLFFFFCFFSWWHDSSRPKMASMGKLPHLFHLFAFLLSLCTWNILGIFPQAFDERHDFALINTVGKIFSGWQWNCFQGVFHS